MDISTFLTKDGRVNSMMLRDKWMIKHMPAEYNNVTQYCTINNIECSRFVEKLWYYLNSVTVTVKCNNSKCTGNIPKFIGLLGGYLEYCSSKCSNSSDKVKQLKEDSCIAKFGTKNPYQSKEVIEKIKTTSLSRYGVENPMQSDDVKSRMINNSINKTGKPWALSKGGTARQTQSLNAKEKFFEKYKEFTIIEYSEEKFGECKLFDPTCGHEFIINKWQAHQRNKIKNKMCTVCNPMGSFNETAWQTELCKWLIDNGIQFKEKDRKTIGLELDILLTDNNLAIELNGTYWHSSKFREPTYHLNKTTKCEALGIQLIHVFEDEWEYSKEIVLSRLANILKLNQEKIYARKCVTRQVSSKEAKSFLNDNHIQGEINSSIKLGLYYNEELVSLMTFGKLRKSLGSDAKDGQFEMYRFCNKKGANVIGAASKLLKYFITESRPIQVISYADRRWSLGNLYQTLGFVKIKETVPNYWYVKNGKRVHRFQWTKEKMQKALGVTDLSSAEMEEQLGLNRIYDSGNLKFILYLEKIE
jgi:hypothetical protein